MRIRRVKLTAQQMLSRNLSEAIVDKDNHAVDACKYLLMSHPEPTIKTLQEIAAEAVAPLAAAGDLSSAYVRHKQIMEEQRQKIRPARLAARGGTAERSWARTSSTAAKEWCSPRAYR